MVRLVLAIFIFMLPSIADAQQHWMRKALKLQRESTRESPRERASRVQLPVGHPPSSVTSPPPHSTSSVMDAPSPPSVRKPVRIALLIANQAYDPSVGILKNPYNDIELVGASLLSQGFEVLPPIRDGGRSATFQGVRELVQRLKAAAAGSIGFVYYSGHGAADKDTNVNYLIPVDVREPGSPHLLGR
jgi:Caspase domain